MDKEIIRRNFSRCARFYDRYSNIQRLSASGLIQKLEQNGVTKILDIGCGTGNFTAFLKRRFRSADIKAVDISPQMIKIAMEKFPDAKIDFIIADGETIELKERFDLITSNACFQWFCDLGRALLRYKKSLNKDGLILFSIFGPLTFVELEESLKELLGTPPGLSSSGFLDKSGAERMMKGIFNEVEIERRIYCERHPSLTELLKKIKYTGSRGNGMEGRRLWSPKMVGDLEKIYRARFGDITATYEVIFCKGVKEV